MPTSALNTLRIAVLALISGWIAPASAVLFTDGLENIGADGALVSSRTIGGVTVGITTAIDATDPMEARTYFDGSPRAFAGAGNADNAPLNPSNVSGTRFISTSRHFNTQTRLGNASPVVFSFSTAIAGFGFTTLDLLESITPAGRTVTLEALNSASAVVASMSLTGPQGGSGLDIDWFVSSPGNDIFAARFTSDLVQGEGGGYGIDNLVVDTVPVPGGLPLLAGALGALAMLRGRR